MDVSVTIVNWNRAALLEECLRSVYATPETVTYEVTVVDHGSSDESVPMLRARFPQAHGIVNASNVGFGRAHNQAMAAARGRYVFMLNNDATVGPATIPALVRLMDDHPRVGACGCPEERQTSLGTAESGAFTRFPSLGRTVMENLWAVVRPPRRWDIGWLARSVHRWMGEELADVDLLEVAWVVGALLILRRDVASAIGGFDERFFLFDEDADLCRRIRAAGWVVAFTTRTSFSHRGGASSALRTDIEQVRGRSRALYFRKHAGRWAEAVARIQHFVLRSCLLSWRRRLERLAGGIDRGR
jgi:N-acetylglucosaminyl-diphospho-decaprenol L-rhamnosyltransferase